MLKFIVFVVLIPITIFLLSAFINGLFELNHEEKENRKRILREGLEGYLDRTFGYGTAKIFKSILDAEGLLSYVIYLPHYDWFKSTKYQWFEISLSDKGYTHSEIKA
ncbi:hypothetical protein E2K98_26945 [Bacillus salipaludis]|uniref:Uncharacterized protein n=1 Tax=Bacillus salipaludis TaxID=2547811 RepID=A0A4V6PMC0_9BACI|nr:hypothetical protein [Bacillus salipaludis]MDQ6595562.1 hypothetical protein [Bacillus salipaludis]TDK56288.1 hypothetical protein E2K98_26945 [Bacillus salipaludis]